ncbi:MAG: alpha-amylase/4-alpha-glucanotransferase domain-containing protein [Candidatus Helarchaeota archaeon]
MDQATSSQKKINFPIVFHFHQPVGNFGHIIDVAYKVSYRPLIQTLDYYPKVKVGLHFSGYLLEWLVENKPDYIDLLKKLVDRKQVEIVGGAYYEPIIAMIPDEDKFQQITLLRDFIRELFSVDVEGFWLAERVWEPHLPKILEEANIKYIFIDDYHLRMNGLSEEETFYTYVTEEQGSKVNVVPINEHLRYITPWKPVEQTFDYLSKNLSLEPERLICLIDDAEKYGLWGTTHKICYKEGYDGTPWMDKLFSMVEKTPWCRSLTLSEYFKEYKPRGLIYLPTTSYDKMSYWVLPTPERTMLENLIKKAKAKKLENSQEILKFLRGGFWRQFLVKYHEANNMHKKMLWVRDKLRYLEANWGRNEQTKKAAREIYKAQCNDPYWHGQFGGVYFAFMRHNVYSYLIEAEKIIVRESESHQKLTPVIGPCDIDKDGWDEILLETSQINIYFHPFYAGSIFELDYKPKPINILNTFQRRKEAYYTKDLDFIVDRWRRYAFFDHFVEEDVTLEDVKRDRYGDLGDFLEKHYETEINQAEKLVNIRLSADGQVLCGADLVPIRVSKFFEVIEDKNQIKVIINVKNKSENSVELIYLTEFPFYLTGDLNKILFKYDKSQSDILTDEEFSAKTILVHAQDLDIKLKFALSELYTIYKYNLYTYATTNGGYDTLYQGTVLAFRIPMKLDPEEIKSCTMNITIE